jgi:4-amino-4-deoxy-L-arabinose transferase-like glycosyltransferase
VAVVSVAWRVPLLWGGQIDYDEGVYWESLRSMSAGHPLFSSVYSSQPPAFLPLLAPFFALGHSIAGARLGVLLFFAVALAATWVVARTLFGPVAGLVGVVLVAVDPLMLRQSLALQADGPATALGVLAVAGACLAVRRRGSAAAVLCALAGAALALGVLVKLLAVALAVPAILVLIVPLGGQPWPGVQRVLVRLGWALWGAVLAGAVVLLPFAGRMRLVWSQAVGGHIAARSLHEGGLTHDMAVALARESPFYLAGAAGLALLLWRAPRIGIVLAAWGAAAAALAVVQHPLWPHHLVVASPLVAIAAAGAASVVLRSRRRIGAAAGALLAVGVAGLATGILALQSPATADTVRAAVAVLQRATRPGDLLLTDDQWAVAAAGRDTPPELVDTSFVRLDSEGIDAAAIEAIASRAGVVAVYTATQRLPHIGGLLDWVRAHFPHSTVIASNAILSTGGP